MRLSELNPHWVGYDSPGFYIGITFLCPHCMLQRIGVLFKHPINNTDIKDFLWHTDEKTWDVSGNSFENLTISPSIDVKYHWHGFVQNGEVK